MQLLRLAAAGVLIPADTKLESGGEDAFFVASAGCGAVGVADGVGGWGEEGVDAAAYARQVRARAVGLCWVALRAAKCGHMQLICVGSRLWDAALDSVFAA